MRAVEAERDRLTVLLEKEEARARASGAGLASGGSWIGDIKAHLAGLGFMLNKTPIELQGRGAADAPGALHGRAIREAAVALLVRRGFDAGPIHYRSWLALLEESGRSVVGRRPDAVFLSQVARHPLVRRATRPGFYELDPDAIGLMESRIVELQASLGTALAGGTPGRSAVSREAYLELTRVARRLEEARGALAADAIREASTRNRRPLC